MAHGLSNGHVTLKGQTRDFNTLLERNIATTAGFRDSVPKDHHTNKKWHDMGYHGTRAFAVAGPKAWNQLPMHIRARESVGSFKTALKSHFHFVD